MMARWVARQFRCLRGVHGYSMDDEQAAKTKFSAGSYPPQANVMPKLKRPQTGRQRSRRREAPPNGQSGFKQEEGPYSHTIKPISIGCVSKEWKG